MNVCFFLSVGVVSSLCVSVLSSEAQIPLAVIDHRSLLTEPIGYAWDNPAVFLYRFDTSLTQVEGGGEWADDLYGGSFKADTYLVNDRFGVTGNVRYGNARRKSGHLTETSDPEIVGPFLTYASGDGSMREEEYEFGGSYTSRLGRWNVGVSGGYLAGLYYLTVDPRPRNVTGTLQLNPAASFLVTSDYALAAGFTFVKYKQSSSISFVSELGQNMIHHLTGLGTAYGRFDGQGEKSYFTGYSFGGQIGLLPVSSGFYAYVDFSSMNVEKILSDLNKLPLGRTTTPVCKGEAGWRAKNWVVGINGLWERRRARENLFGDAVSGQYPQIGSLTLYSRTRRAAGVSGSYQGKHFSALAEAKWESDFEQHISPLRHLEWQQLELGLSLQGWLTLRRGGLLMLTLRGTSFSPLTHSHSGLSTTDEELKPVIDVLLRTYRLHTTSHFGAEVKAEALFPLRNKFMLGGEVIYARNAGSSAGFQPVSSGSAGFQPVNSVNASLIFAF